MNEVMVRIVEALGWSLLHFLWQGAVVGGLLYVVLGLTRKATPEVRYSILGWAMLLMVGLVVATFWKQLFEEVPVAQTKTAEMVGSSVLPPEQQDSPSKPVDVMALAEEGEGREQVRESAMPAGSPVERKASGKMLFWVVGFWGFGVLCFSARLIGSWFAIQRLKRGGQVPDESGWLHRFAEIGQNMKVRQSVRLFVSEKIQIPMVIGWLKPVVLVPTAMMSGLPVAQMEAILAHELAHVRRQDFLFNLLQSVAETLLFFHPVVWWVGSQLRKEREHCCDDMAAKVSGSALEYARSLVALEEVRGAAVPLMGVAASDGSLSGRVRRLVAVEPTPGTRPVWSACALVLLAIVGLFWMVSGGAADAEEADLKKMVTVQVVDGEGGKPVSGLKMDFPTGQSFHTDEKEEARVPRTLIEEDHLWISSGGYLSDGQFAVRFMDEKPVEIKDPHVVTVWRGDELKGRVLNARRQPIAGASVAVSARVNHTGTMQKLGIPMSRGSWDLWGPNWSGSVTSPDIS